MMKMLHMGIMIVEEWKVVDEWWTEDPIEIFYKEVSWYGRRLVFKRTPPERVWRISGNE